MSTRIRLNGIAKPGKKGKRRREEGAVKADTKRRENTMCRGTTPIDTRIETGGEG